MCVYSIGAQSSDEEPFIQGLIRALERLNWSTTETGVLERQLSMLEWKRFEGVDPEVVAIALSYGKERGVDDTGEHIKIALDVAESVRRMSALGLSSRESAGAVLRGMRMAAPDGPDFAEQLVEQVRLQIHGEEGKALRRRIENRTDRPSETETWTPPTPEERPGGGRADIPVGPGDNPGFGGTEGPNGGR